VSHHDDIKWPTKRCNIRDDGDSERRGDYAVACPSVEAEGLRDGCHKRADSERRRAKNTCGAWGLYCTRGVLGGERGVEWNTGQRCGQCPTENGEKV
jgi:hypothetical protein